MLFCTGTRVGIQKLHVWMGDSWKIAPSGCSKLEKRRIVFLKYSSQYTAETSMNRLFDLGNKKVNKWNCKDLWNITSWFKLPDPDPWLLSILGYSLVHPFLLIVHDKSNRCLNMNTQKEWFDMNSIEIHTSVSYRSLEVQVSLHTCYWRHIHCHCPIFSLRNSSLYRL